MKRKILNILFWLAVWYILALWVDNDILLATPFQTAAALCRMVCTSAYWMTVSASVVRIAAGFVCGMSVACILAALSASCKMFEELMKPFIMFLKAVPVASYVIMLLIWWGSSFLSVAICFLVVLPVIYVNVLEGIKNTDVKLLQMADIFVMPFKSRFFYIYRPALRPFLESGLKLALGMCWKSGVAAEVIGTPAFSIGERLYMSKLYLDTPGLFAWTASIILLSMGFERLFLWFTERFFVWEPACRKAAGHKHTYDKNDMPARIVCRNVNKKYSDLSVITNLDAIYNIGETYYFTSPSGSGKTTLFRIICGLEQPDSGSVERINIRFSYAFQEDRLCEDYSAVKNVEMALGDAAKAKEALGMLLSEEALDKPCSQLSGGMKRRVALVRAMEAESECVILDEPFAGMDAQTKTLAEEYIRMRQRGRIMLIATHI